MNQIEQIIARGTVIPVVVIDSSEDAPALAEALLEGGIRVIEITLRTPQALAAAESVARKVPDIALGIGSVLDPAQLADVSNAGARFVVTPGTPPAMAAALVQSGLAALPGCCTPSEALALRAQGFRHLKFFPAEPAGGVPFLKALAGPMADMRFCPTGGIDLARAASYLALPNVPCVGGSWLAPEALVRARNWPAITALARQTCATLATPS